MRRRIAPLTGIRGVAATWVLLFHARALLDRIAIWPWMAGSPIARSGYLAVDLFFILSGYILARSHAARFERTAMGTFAAAFYLNRLFRILPLNAVCLMLLLAAATAVGFASWPTPMGTPRSFVAALLLVQNWGFGTPTSWNVPAWSLSTEWLAYCGFPIAMAAVVRHVGARGALLLHAVSLSGLAITMLAVGGGSLGHTWLLGLPRCILQFVAGMALWRWSTALATPARPDLILLAGFAGVIVAVALPQLELLAPLAFSAIVLACALEGRITEAAFGNRLVEFVGEISFSLYLIHFPLLGLCEWLAATRDVAAADEPIRAAFAVTSLAATYAAAILLWRWIELPGQRVGRQLEQRWFRTAAQVAPRPIKAD